MTFSLLFCGTIICFIFTASMAEIKNNEFFQLSAEVTSPVLMSPGQNKCKSSVTCAATCVLVSNCCFFDFDKSTMCSLYSCSYSAMEEGTRGELTKMVATESFFKNKGFTFYDAGRYYKLVIGEHHWTRCNTECGSPFSWGTLFVPHSEEDWMWIETEIIPLTIQKGVFIGLYTHTNEPFYWADGTPYTDARGLPISSVQDRKEMVGALIGNGRFYLTSYYKTNENPGCSCLCQVYL